MLQDFSGTLENIRLKLYNTTGVFDSDALLEKSIEAYRQAIEGASAEEKGKYDARLREFLYRISDSMNAKEFNVYLRKLKRALDETKMGGVLSFR